VPQTLPKPLQQVSAAEHDFSGNREFDAPALLRLWHLTSLDAPTVAVVWSLGFAWAAKVRLPVWIPILLALATWAVYIADRVLDGRAAIRTANFSGLRERHRFHDRHRRVLIPIAIAAACAAAGMVFTLMPWAARERNSVLAMAALVYFARVHFPRRISFGLASLSRVLKKEMLVGILFTAACALPAISRVTTYEVKVLWPMCAAGIVFALVAWLNCYAIDRWEAGEEPRKTQIQLAAYLLGFAGLLLAAVISFVQPRVAALIVAGAVSALLLALIDWVRGRLTPIAVRAAADLVLLAPLALLLK
jgi:hypothetical protein